VSVGTRKRLRAGSQKTGKKKMRKKQKQDRRQKESQRKEKKTFKVLVTGQEGGFLDSKAGPSHKGERKKKRQKKTFKTEKKARNRREGEATAGVVKRGRRVPLGRGVEKGLGESTRGVDVRRRVQERKHIL